MCSDEDHALVLLADLSASSSKRASVIDGICLQPDDSRKEGMLGHLELFDASCMMRQSRCVFELVARKFPKSFSFRVSPQSLSHGSSEMISTRTTVVEVSEAFATLYQGEVALPRPAGVDILRPPPATATDTTATGGGGGGNGRGEGRSGGSSSESFPWVSVLTSSCSRSLVGSSGSGSSGSSGSSGRVTLTGARQRVVVVPGEAVMQALVLTRQLLGPPQYARPRPGQCLEDDPLVRDEGRLPYCHSLVQHAVQLHLLPALPASWSIACDQDDDDEEEEEGATGRDRCRYQIVLEDFSSPVSTHAASGRLAKAVSSVDDTRILSQGGAGTALPPSTLKLGKDGEDLSVEACKDIISLFPLVQPVLVLYLNTECSNCTVIQTKSRKETTKWLEIFVKAVHEESLLF
jgi:hypothetical protein